MVKKSELIKKMDFFCEDYKIEKDIIILKTQTSLLIYIVFENGQVKIQGKLAKWNFLTGFMKMSLFTSYKYLTVIISFGVIFLYVFKILFQWKGVTVDLNTVVFGLAILILIAIWIGVTFLYYNSLFQHKKRQLLIWIESTSK